MSNKVSPRRLAGAFADDYDVLTEAKSVKKAQHRDASVTFRRWTAPRPAERGRDAGLRAPGARIPRVVHRAAVSDRRLTACRNVA